MNKAEVIKLVENVLANSPKEMETLSDLTHVKECITQATLEVFKEQGLLEE